MRYEAEWAALPAPFRVEHHYADADCLVEVRRYFWADPIERAVLALSAALVVNMALTARPPHTRIGQIAKADDASGSGGGADPGGGEAGRLLVMIPGAPYRLAAPSGAFRSLHCAIGCAKLEAVAGGPIDWTALTWFAGEQRADAALETQLTTIHDELIRRAIGRDLVIAACLDRIAVALVRRFREGRPARPDVLAGGLAAWRMRAVLGRIHADAPAPRLAELAAICGLTERQLGRAFKAETGQTLGRVIAEATMERAHRLLTTTAAPIAAIARELGFASADSFAQAYRRHTGAPPSKVRQR